jgi:hypothetical protein
LLEAIEDSRQADPSTALGWLERLERARGPNPARGWTTARLLEQLGRPQEAFEALERASRACPLEDQPRLEATGRRLARALRRAWRPLPPLLAPPTRTVHLKAAAGDGHRRRFAIDGTEVPVEEALCRLLSQLGRRALPAEGPLWAELGMLLLSDLCFLPVPDALPLPYLSAPLDFGRPGFLERRAAAWAELQAALLAGDAPALAASALARRRGERIRGVGWSLREDDVQRALSAVPGAFLIALTSRLAEGGLRAAAGLPDLLLLPGDPVRLPGFPAALGRGVVLVEAKSEGDQVRPAQAAWHHRLLANGVACEVWRVVAAP